MIIDLISFKLNPSYQPLFFEKKRKGWVKKLERKNKQETLFKKKKLKPLFICTYDKHQGCLCLLLAPLVEPRGGGEKENAVVSPPLVATSPTECRHELWKEAESTQPRIGRKEKRGLEMVFI